MGIESEIQKVTRKSLRPKIFLYGLAGSGKTTFIGSAAKAGLPVLLLKSEEGAMSIADTGVDAITIQHGTEDPRARLREIMKWIYKEGRSKYAVVALDSLSFYQRAVENYIRARNKDNTLTKQNWGEIIDATNSAISMLTSIPQTVIVTCHTQEFADGDDGIIVRPSLSGKKLPNEVTAPFDIVAYCSRREQKGGNGIRYVCLTSYPGEKYAVKDRTGALSQVEDNDFAVWREKILASGAPSEQ